MTVKICTIEDIGQLLQIYMQSYGEHYTYLWIDNGESYIRSNFNFDRLNEEMSNPNSIYFMIYDGECAIGLIKLNINCAVQGFSADEALELERIYFIKEASGKGFGKEAINFVSNFAKQRNKSTVWLKAMDTSAALDFYKKRGFQIIGETKVTYTNIIEEFSRMYIMVLQLN